MNRLFYRDILKILRDYIEDESVDLFNNLLTYKQAEKVALENNGQGSLIFEMET